MIEEGDCISARFTYNGIFSKAFTGSRPNSTAVQIPSIDILRVKDGKLIDHWDEFNLLEVFQQIGAAIHEINLRLGKSGMNGAACIASAAAHVPHPQALAGRKWNRCGD